MNKRRSHLKRAILGLSLVATLLLVSGVLADSPPSEPAAGPISLTGTEDGGGVEVYDVGAEHVADAPPAGAGGSDLPICATSASNFYNKLRAAGFTGANDFLYANSLAWERDFKRAALGGTENSYIDNVDICYYCDHGDVGAVYFPWGHTDNWLVPGDCYQSWGDKDNEWAAFGTCLSLTNRQGWANCMNGQHLILGYITVSYDSDEGGKWADYMLGWRWLGVWMRAPKTVAQSWFCMCDDTQPSGVTARVIAEDSRHFNDKIWGRGGPAYGDVVDNYYSWLDHPCYKAPPTLIDTSTLAAMQTYEVVSRNVTEGYAQSIAGILGLEGQVQLSPDGTEFAVADTSGNMTRTLAVSTAGGGYNYQNLSQLWVPPDPNAPLSLPTPEEALALANSFILDNQALPGIQNRDASIAHAETDRLYEEARPSGLSGDGAEAALQSTGVDVMVTYGRSLPTGARLASGTVMTASVVGPGSATKLYYGGQGGGLAQQQLPIGLTGGSRDVQAGSSVTIKSADETWNAFLADHQLAVVVVPLDADEIIRKAVSDTVAYYEQPRDVPQVELIPVWAFRADFKKAGQLLASDVLVYVPASPDYYPPNVTIDQPADGSYVPFDRPVTFSATAVGPFAPFTYQWVSSQSGVLGAGQTITATLTAGTGVERAGFNPQTMSVKATNANGQSRTVNIVLRFAAPINLPLISRAG